MGKAGVISHKGKSIFYMDFSGIKSTDEVSQLISESKRYIGTQPASSLLTLTNITQMHFNNEIKDLFTTFVKGNKPYVKAGAVVGISGLQGIVYNAIMKLTGRNVKSMSSLDEAKDWLSLQA